MKGKLYTQQFGSTTYCRASFGDGHYYYAINYRPARLANGELSANQGRWIGSRGCLATGQIRRLTATQARCTVARLFA